MSRSTWSKPRHQEVGRAVPRRSSSARFAEETDFTAGTSLEEYPGYSAEQILGRPTKPDRRPGPAVDPRLEPTGIYDSLPPGEVGVRRNQRVYASDGEIGRIEGIVIDSAAITLATCCCKRGTCLAAEKRISRLAPSPGLWTASSSTSPSSRWRTCRREYRRPQRIELQDTEKRSHSRPDSLQNRPDRILGAGLSSYAGPARDMRRECAAGERCMS